MSNNIAQQTIIEHQTLKHVIEAIQTVLNWHPSEVGMPRKLTSLRFITGALQRHLDYMLTLEEKDGYMPQILATSPHLAGQVESLRMQHDEFREALRQIVTSLEQAAANDQQQIVTICEHLAALLDDLDKHSKMETDLVQEAFLREEGGEG